MRQVHDLEHGALKLLQEGGLMAASPASSTAFVTFKEARACVTAEQVSSPVLLAQSRRCSPRPISIPQAEEFEKQMLMQFLWKMPFFC